MRLLSDMLADLPIHTNVEGSVNAAISSITTDSRNVTPGALFVAIAGTKIDGHAHIAEAVAKGAAAVLVDGTRDLQVPLNVTQVSVENTREALSYFAAAFYDAQPNTIVAVTGTDGKTSTAEFARQFFELQGKSAASIGTLGVLGERAAGLDLPGVSHTSPDPLVMHQLLHGLKQGGIEHVAIEASSHGLDQRRLDAVNLDAAAVTLITRDHLDYHGTEEAYMHAKLRLFTELLPSGKTAILNADDAHYGIFRFACEKAKHAILTYGRAGEDIRILDIVANAQGLSVKLRVMQRDLSLVLPLYGDFQVMNICAALALSGHSGDLAALADQAGRLKGVPGRMERVTTHPSGAAIFIDYAHTPAALAKVLQVARRHVRGAVHVVFGCGGDRDSGKRPLMGEAAAQYADHITVTDDNPRSEDPATIRAAILARCPGAKEIGDRCEAIAFALSQLNSNDALIVAGKGHETTQIIGTQHFHFNDAEIIREEVAKL